MIECALEYAKPVRIGVNWGSLDAVLLARMMDENAALAEPLPPGQVMKRAIVESALSSARLAESYGLGRHRIILSAKVSGVQDLIDVYRMLAAGGDWALHLGLTEAGMGAKGIVASAAAVGLGDDGRPGWPRRSSASAWWAARSSCAWGSRRTTTDPGSLPAPIARSILSQLLRL